MLIFALGTYNLFISKLDNVKSDSEKNPNIVPEWLQIKDFSELKALFMKVIILILGIFLLEKLISFNSKVIKIENILYFLFFPISILLISWSLRLIEFNKNSDKRK